MNRTQTWKNFDFLLFGTVVLLAIFGVAMIRSAIAGNVLLMPLVERQMIYIAIALVMIIVLTLVDYRYWAALAQMMYWVAVLSLVVIYVYGTARFGAARWLDTGLILIQPSELAKIIMIIVLADYFARTRHETRNLRWIGLSFVITVGVVLWILLQPNLSTSIVIFVIWFAMLWISGLPFKYVAIFGSIAAVVLTLVLTLALLKIENPLVGGENSLIKPYQIGRITNFIAPDPEARHGNDYNVEQSRISIGSGGWFGQGYGHSSQVQLRFLKVRHTDFIFSAMAAEFGFVGTMVVILGLLFVVFRCFRIASQAADTFGGLIAFGFGVLLLFQTAVNIGVNLNVLPVTGLTLPFISYGGSSMVSLAFGIGLVESVSLRRTTLDS